LVTGQNIPTKISPVKISPTKYLRFKISPVQIIGATRGVFRGASAPPDFNLAPPAVQ